MQRPQKRNTGGCSFIQMINAALSYYSDVSTHNRTNSPCPYKQTNWGQDAGPRATAEFSGLSHTQRDLELCFGWQPPLNTGEDVVEHGATTTRLPLQSSANCWAAVWSQAEPWHSWLQRRKISLAFTFTTSCCLGCVNARGTRQYSPV